MSNAIHTNAPLRALVLIAAAIALLAMPAAAAAKGGNRGDRDGMPTKWERKHRLNPLKNDAKRDRDRDGLTNVAEYQTGMSPRNPDSDDDGLKDGAEGAGTVVKYDNRILTLKLFNGSTVTGRAMTRLTEMCGGEPREIDPPGEGEDPSDPDVYLERTAVTEDEWPSGVEGDTDGDGVMDPDYDPNLNEDNGEAEVEGWDDNGCGIDKLVRGAVIAESNFVKRKKGYNYSSDAAASFFNHIRFAK